MPFAYYRRLSAGQKQIYDQSAGITNLAVPAPQLLAPCIAAIARGLHNDHCSETQRAAQEFTTQLLSALRVPLVHVRVLAKRPSRNWGELHGLYETGVGGTRAKITVWMRTAQRRDVVAFKTFLRTLLHEIGHHLDYEYLKLADSLHTEGFYKRESSLFRQLVPDARRLESLVSTSCAAADAARASTRRKGVPAKQAAASERAPTYRQGSLFEKKR